MYPEIFSYRYSINRVNLLNTKDCLVLSCTHEIQKFLKYLQPLTICFLRKRKYTFVISLPILFLHATESECVNRDYPLCCRLSFVSLIGKSTADDYTVSTFDQHSARKIESDLHPHVELRFNRCKHLNGRYSCFDMILNCNMFNRLHVDT